MARGWSPRGVNSETSWKRAGMERGKLAWGALPRKPRPSSALEARHVARFKRRAPSFLFEQVASSCDLARAPGNSIHVLRHALYDADADVDVDADADAFTLSQAHGGRGPRRGFRLRAHPFAG